MDLEDEEPGDYQNPAAGTARKEEQAKIGKEKVSKTKGTPELRVKVMEL